MSSKKKIPDNNGKTYKTHKTNPKAQLFANYYMSPDSPTFWNIYQSAIKAGYSHLYSLNISTQRPKWWVELTETAQFERTRMLARAQKNLLETLETDPENDTQLKLKTDVSKFVSERLGKDHYSTRQELTDKGGKRLFNNESKDATESSLSHMFKGVQAVEDA